MYTNPLKLVSGAPSRCNLVLIALSMISVPALCAGWNIPEIRFGNMVPGGGSAGCTVDITLIVFKLKTLVFP